MQNSATHVVYLHLRFARWTMGIMTAQPKLLQAHFNDVCCKHLTHRTHVSLCNPCSNVVVKTCVTSPRTTLSLSCQASAGATFNMEARAFRHCDLMYGTLQQPTSQAKMHLQMRATGFLTSAGDAEYPARSSVSRWQSVNGLMPWMNAASVEHCWGRDLAAAAQKPCPYNTAGK